MRPRRRRRFYIVIVRIPAGSLATVGTFRSIGEAETWASINCYDAKGWPLVRWVEPLSHPDEFLDSVVS